ncbi:MAG: asparagine synthase (glutamine-hydrolyzing) [Rhodocyclaceae bacterium]|nr:asparagine synthase (glutamine-hydrolyzing) [Rhodocyclaceae bacterium]
MCGLTGCLGFPLAEAGVLGRMAERIRHRGPDDSGIWLDPEAGIGLAHRRLAVLDLSPTGHQPMISHCGQYVVAFNGEIYNHLDLRLLLQSEGIAPQWRGHSDTETLLACISAWGMETAVKRFSGMFAFALWDRRAVKLVLARDRAGEKPLYYGWQQGIFLFGSELKALAAHPAFRPEVSRDALTLFMRFGYVPEPWSIYRGIYKLPPGCWLELNADAVGGCHPEPCAYWAASAVANEGVRNRVTDPPTALAELEQRLNSVILRQSIADVPLGAFLSGGVDSSLVVALMQAQSRVPVRTFTIGFHEAGFNEAEHAKAVARHLGTDHTELYVTPEEALAVISRLPVLYDEPFADSSQIPTYLVAQLARKHVTVVLSGDGGDELFGGYNRYVWGHTVWRRIGFLPVGMRHVAARVALSLSPQRWDSLAQAAYPVLPSRLRMLQPGDRVHKLASILDAQTPDALYRRLLSQQQDPCAVVVGGSEFPTWADRQLLAANLEDFTERMMCHDFLAYLPGDILTKVDRASMGVSLESRIPLLDHELVEFAWRVPQSMKMRDGQSKWLLRQLLYKHVPRQLIERPKQGFGIPLDCWLRGPLREWAESLLDGERIRREGYLDPVPIRQRWSEHLSGRRNWQYWLWNVLTFQSWLEAQGD